MKRSNTNLFFELIILFIKYNKMFKNKSKKIFNDGYLGSHIDEERSEMRYAMRIAEFRESSDL